MHACIVSWVYPFNKKDMTPLSLEGTYNYSKKCDLLMGIIVKTADSCLFWFADSIFWWKSKMSVKGFQKGGISLFWSSQYRYLYSGMRGSFPAKYSFIKQQFSLYLWLNCWIKWYEKPLKEARIIVVMWQFILVHMYICTYVYFN